MSLLVRMRIQDAVYWAPKGPDRMGDETFDPPFQISVRWETGGTEEVEDGGTRRFTKAKVYVGETVQVGGYLMLGVIGDLMVMLPPPEGEAFPIMSITEIPKIRGNETVRWALL